MNSPQFSIEAIWTINRDFATACKRIGKSALKGMAEIGGSAHSALLREKLIAAIQWQPILPK
jgi:hypothetical protein